KRAMVWRSVQAMKLREVRRNWWLSIVEASVASRLNVSTISAWENGHRSPPEPALTAYLQSISSAGLAKMDASRRDWANASAEAELGRRKAIAAALNAAGCLGFTIGKTSDEAGPESDENG